MITKVDKMTVKRRDGFACVQCKGTEDLTIDHIVPLSRGGTDELSNLQTMCHACNLTKGRDHPSFWHKLWDRITGKYILQEIQQQIKMRMVYSNTRAIKMLEEKVNPKLANIQTLYQNLVDENRNQSLKISRQQTLIELQANRLKHLEVYLKIEWEEKAEAIIAVGYKKVKK